MEIKWFLMEREFENYKKHQQEFSDEDGEAEYIGSARVGNLCFDILNWGNRLWFDLYVGGVDSGYGYSYKQHYEEYPYDYADSCSFCWNKPVQDMSIDDFMKELGEYIENHINTCKEYKTDMKAIHVNLVEKANEEFKFW